mgnify:CR=1 FL=1
MRTDTQTSGGDALGSRHLRQDGLGKLQQALPGKRQLERLALALEQLDAVMRLQGLDLMRNRRLREIQPLGRA